MGLWLYDQIPVNTHQYYIYIYIYSWRHDGVFTLTGVALQ